MIKFLMADTFWHIALKGESRTGESFRIITGLVLASLVMAGGYTLFGAWIYDSIEAGLASTPGLLMESAVNILVFYIGKRALKRISE